MTNFLIRLVIKAGLLAMVACHTPGKPPARLISVDTLSLTAKPDTSENEKEELFAFVGEKIAVNDLPYKAASMDAGYRATYKILQRVYGNYAPDTIEFTAYDHYGWPAFARYKNVLLFVSKYKGQYYHQKYLFSDVYKTKNGRWAGAYQLDDYEHVYNRRTTIKPVIMPFAERVVYPRKMKMLDGTEYKLSYPKPWFRTIGDSAFPVYGNYVEDLFLLKKNGILKARGIFPATREEEDRANDLDPKDIARGPFNAEETKFRHFWKSFTTAAKEPGLKQFKAIALDSLYACTTKIATTAFISRCFKDIFDDELLKRLNNRARLQYTRESVSFSDLLYCAQKEITKAGKIYSLRQVSVKKNDRINKPSETVFNFIETKSGYRLYSIDHHWFEECCKAEKLKKEPDGYFFNLVRYLLQEI